jgi:hypothetical protein
MPLTLTPVEHAYGNEPLPVVARSAETRDRMFELLERLGLNMSLDVNRAKRAAQAYVYRYRRERASEAQFRIRQIRPGWSRIWRVK